MDKAKVKVEAKGTHGRDTHVFVNGTELKTLKKIVIKCGVDDFNEVTLTFAADIDFIGEFNEDKVEIDIE